MSSDIDAFFREWLPRRFAELKSERPDLASTECSLLIHVGQRSWRLDLGAGELQIHAQPPPEPLPTFRLHTTEDSFALLIGEALESQASSNPALNMLKLDSEVVRLAGNIPGCLKLRVVASDGAAHEAVFGPGTKDVSEVGCSVECQLEDLRRVQSGEADPMELFMSGRLQLDGDLQIAMALGGMLL